MKYFLLIAIALSACQSTKNSAKENNSKTMVSYEKIATDSLGEDVQYEWNASKSYVLCKKVTASKYIPMGTKDSQSTSSATGAANVSLIVLDGKTGATLWKKIIAYGSVSWENDTQLRVTEIQGAYSPNNPNTYLYHIVSGDKTTMKKNDMSNQ